MEKIREQVSQFLDREANPVPRDLAVNMVLQFLRDHLTAGANRGWLTAWPCYSYRTAR